MKCDDSLAIMVENEREMENEVKVIGKISSSQDSVVVDAEGISPTHTSGHGNCPKIIEPRIEYLGSYVPSGNSNNPVLGSGGVSTTIRANMHGMPPAVIDNLGSYKPNGYNASCVVGDRGIAPTVRENHGEVTAVLEPKIIGYTRDREKGKVVNRTIKDESGTIHSSTGGGGNTSQFVLEPKYRIRKLTERECFRLMDVDDADIDKIQKGYFDRASLMPLSYGKGEDRNNPAVKDRKCDRISKSQMYKMAGNSICVGVLYHIFRKMFVEQGNEEQQLKLF